MKTPSTILPLSLSFLQLTTSINETAPIQSFSLTLNTLGIPCLIVAFTSQLTVTPGRLIPVLFEGGCGGVTQLNISQLGLLSCLFHSLQKNPRGQRGGKGVGGNEKRKKSGGDRRWKVTGDVVLTWRWCRSDMPFQASTWGKAESGQKRGG